VCENTHCRNLIRLNKSVAERYYVLGATVNKATLSCEHFFNRLLPIIFSSVVPICILITRFSHASERWYQVVVRLGLCRADSVVLPSLLTGARSHSYALLIFFTLFSSALQMTLWLLRLYQALDKVIAIWGTRLLANYRKLMIFPPVVTFTVSLCMCVDGCMGDCV